METEDAPGVLCYCQIEYNFARSKFIVVIILYIKKNYGRITVINYKEKYRIN